MDDLKILNKLLDGHILSSEELERASKLVSTLINYLNQQNT